MTGPNPAAADATTLPQVAVRPATAADLPRFAPIYRHADADWLHIADDSPEAPAIDAEVAADLVVLAAGPPGSTSVMVVEAAGVPVGFGAAAIRGRHWHLAYLFVEPAWQGQGIGGRLLRDLHRAAVDAGCDVFTTEPSADARGMRAYLGLGMLPRHPALRFAATDPTFPSPRWDDDLDAVPVGADDDHLIATLGDIDAVVRGVRRPDDHRRWLTGGATAVVLVRRESAVPAGYAMLRPEEPGYWRIGPIAALDGDRMADVLARTLATAATLHRPSDRWRLDLPGDNHAAIPPLLAAGFRPERVIPLLASGPIGRWDRYVFADLDTP